VSDPINPEEFNKFQFPQDLLEKIFELTGDADQHKGFIISYVDQVGNPVIYERTQNQVIGMGLRKSLESYLANLDQNEDMFGLGNDDFENPLD
jgi:hypothetical protein